MHQAQDLAFRQAMARDARRFPDRWCLPGVSDSGSRPAAGGAPGHLSQPAFRQRIAGLHAERIRSHRRVIDGAGFGSLIITLLAGGDSRQPGGLARGPPRRA